jgi:UDP-GlcNAc:undecaprenyl-phosphate GlcNAc-1-phosphate transferase
LYLLASLLVGVMGYFLYKCLGWLDNPQKYGFKRAPVPYSFGLVLYVIFAGGAVSFLPFSLDLLGILIGGLGVSVMGFLDDRYDLSPVVRFLGQVFFACLVVFCGAEILEVSVPLSDSVLVLGGIGFLVSVVWIVFLTNVLNFLDGVSGLTSSVSFSAFLALVGLAIIPGVHVVNQDLVIVLGALMAGIALVGTILEFDKPRVLIGDSGTTFFGFMLAVLSMINGGKLATLGLVLIVPIVDGVGVLVMRVLNKRKPWQGDFNHLHHLLLKAGFSRRLIVVWYSVLSIVLALISVFFWNSIVKFLSLGLIVIGLVFVLLYNHKKYADWKKFDKLESS